MYFRILPDETSGAMSYLLADLDTRGCVLLRAHKTEANASSIRDAALPAQTL